MIDPDNLLSARTVEDIEINGKILGTKVGDRVLSRDPDTISPLQRALDYEITQTLFVGRSTLLVEGPSDLVYLKWFSHQLKAAGRTELDYRWVICPVGGVDRIPGFAALFKGNRLNLVGLVDVAKGSKKKIENASTALGDDRLLQVAKYAGQEEADIEDVLGRDFYVALVNAAYDLTAQQRVPNAKPSDAASRTVIEVENHMRTIGVNVAEFDHYAPAKWLFDNDDEGKKLPEFDDAMSRMEQLIKDINGRIAKGS